MINPRKIEEEIKVSYLEYAMSVIANRAIPDARDGLKPVQRRIIYAMNEVGFTHDKPYKKSARIVGETMGKYHPHGDAAIYDTVARMAQDFSMRYLLIDGQGNFGSIDGDEPAAMRYTEARLEELAEQMVKDIEKDTVPFRLNFDGSLKEPEYLPTKIPNLLINGTSGIAVGMATSLVPHNIVEICSAIRAQTDDPEITLHDLLGFIKGPDFPGGGIAFRDDNLLQAYTTGRGKVKARGQVDLSKEKRIIITSLPYEVNKARYIENLADKVKNDQIRGIVDIRDESDKQGIRIVIKLRDEGSKDLINNQLYEITDLEKTVSVINLVLVDNQPKTLNIKELIEIFIQHRLSVILARSRFDLDKSREREHLLEGLYTATTNLDLVLDIIRKSPDAHEAKDALIQRLNLSERQASAILDMRLQRLTSQETDKIKTDLEELRKKISGLTELISKESLRRDVLKEEMQELIDKYGDDRRTTIIEGEVSKRSVIELIPKEDCVIILTERGILKRVSLSEYRSQRRGGKGILTSTWKEDVVRTAVSGTSHDDILYFSSLGRVYSGKVYQIEKRARTSIGVSVHSFLKLQEGETIKQIMIPQFTEESTIVVATQKGYITRIAAKTLANIRINGINFVRLVPGDVVISVETMSGNELIAVVSDDAKIAMFEPRFLRILGRNTRGVKSMQLAPGKKVISAFLVTDDVQVLSVSEKGIGKRTPVNDFPVHRRGTKGVFIFRQNRKTGKLVTALPVRDSDEILILTKGEKSIRTSVDKIRIISRVTSGVRLMDLEKDDRVISVTRI